MACGTKAALLALGGTGTARQLFLPRAVDALLIHAHVHRPPLLHVTHSLDKLFLTLLSPQSSDGYFNAGLAASEPSWNELDEEIFD